MNPTVTKILKRSYPTHAAYRIEGGTLASGWEPRPGCVAWCEVVVWRDSEHLGSYGGEVWPSAWPSLFEAIPPSVSHGSGGFRILPAARALLDAAVAS